MGMNPSQFSGQGVAGGTSTQESVGFGTPQQTLNATFLRVMNRGSDDAYINFASTSAGTTDDCVLTSGEIVTMSVVPHCGGLTVTSLSTGVGVDIWALG